MPCITMRHEETQHPIEPDRDPRDRAPRARRPATLYRVLCGQRVRANSFERIRRALVETGRADLVPEDV